MITSLRARLIVLAAVVVLAAGGAVTYVLAQRDTQQRAKQDAAPVAETSLASVRGKPHVVFRSTAVHSHYGDVAIVALDDPTGPRAFTSVACDRVYGARSHLLCLSSDPGVVTTYAAHILDATTLAATQTLPLAGIPSRARLSGDGRLAATTTFVSGDSYASTSFSTRTVITAVGGTSYGSLEQFTLLHEGKRIAPVDRNFWGVTFAADDNTFYATASWSQHTWLVRGDLRTRTVTTLHEDAECPSLSPDGKHIVFKQRGDLPAGHWRLAEYDLASGTVTRLAENRSVDDQVEWLDDDTVIYGLPRGGASGAIDDIWRVPADGTGKPRVFIPQAWSPSVVR